MNIATGVATLCNATSRNCQYGLTLASVSWRQQSVKYTMMMGQSRRLRTLVLCAAGLMCALLPAKVRGAQANWTTYLRVGPGLQYAVIDEVEAQDAITVQGCDKGWCRDISRKILFRQRRRQSQPGALKSRCRASSRSKAGTAAMRRSVSAGSKAVSAPRPHARRLEEASLKTGGLGGAARPTQSCL
jgi:hypothetical protein